MKLKNDGIHSKNVKISFEMISEFPTDCNLYIEHWFSDDLKLKEIPSNVTEIYNWKFLDTSIRSLTIPSSVEKISKNWLTKD